MQNKYEAHKPESNIPHQSCAAISTARKVAEAEEEVVGRGRTPARKQESCRYSDTSIRIKHLS